MAWIRLIEREDAEPALAARYAAIADPVTGDVDNILKVHGLDPIGLDAHLALYRSAMRDTAALPKVDRELLAVVVSRANDCGY